MKSGNVLLGTVIALGAIFLSCLGLWQLHRLEWKRSLIERVETNLTSEPLSFEQVERLVVIGGDIEYRPVSVSGTYDHTKEQHFFATHKGRSGYYVYTPLVMKNATYLFVNRGFVPMERKDSSSRRAGQLYGNVFVEGLARAAPLQKPNSFVPDNDLEANIFYWKSLAQMKIRAFGAEPVDVAAFIVDADDTPNKGGLPEGGVTRIEFPNSHLQYALTWFGLALALLAVGGYFLRGRMRLNSAL